MHWVRLIRWKAEESADPVRLLRAAGYQVDYEALTPNNLRALREDPPEAIVIDLSRVPSQGRDVAVGFRIHTATRTVPLVLVGGAPEKVAQIQEILPDATYTSWDQIEGALKYAIAHPPADPVVPESVFAGYSGTPLTKKLGIKENSVVGLISAPEGFEESLGKLPEGVILRRSDTSQANITLWFMTSRTELEREIGRMGSLAENGGLWIIWPKKTSGVESDLSQTIVRKAGLASGLVDFKVCAVDKTWSGLRFTQRIAD